MPSDAKKREQQRKKEAAKARQAGAGKKNEKTKTEEQNDVLKSNGVNGVNGAENGSTELSAEGKTTESSSIPYIFQCTSPFHSVAVNKDV